MRFASDENGLRETTGAAAARRRCGRRRRRGRASSRARLGAGARPTACAARQSGKAARCFSVRIGGQGERVTRPSQRTPAALAKKGRALGPAPQAAERDRVAQPPPCEQGPTGSDPRHRTRIAACSEARVNLCPVNRPASRIPAGWRTITWCPPAVRMPAAAIPCVLPGLQDGSRPARLGRGRVRKACGVEHEQGLV